MRRFGGGAAVTLGSGNIGGGGGGQDGQVGATVEFAFIGVLIMNSKRGGSTKIFSTFNTFRSTPHKYEFH